LHVPELGGSHADIKQNVDAVQICEICQQSETEDDMYISV